MIDVVLVKANLSDISDVMFFEEKCFSNLYKSKKNLGKAEEYMGKSIVYFIVVDSKKVGTVSYIDEGEEAYINALTVLPEFRGRGIGALAMGKLIKMLRSFSKFTLTVHPDNISALIIYLKLGFRIKKFVENCYGDGEPRLYLERVNT